MTEIVTVVRATCELETQFLFDSRGLFQMMINDANIAGMPVIIFFGPVAEGIGQVVPELPKGLRPDDKMLLIVETALKEIPAPPGWVNMGQSSQYLAATISEAAVKYLSVFHRTATDIEPAPTVWALDDHIIAQILACRPKEGS